VGGSVGGSVGGGEVVGLVVPVVVGGEVVVGRNSMGLHTLMVPKKLGNVSTNGQNAPLKYAIESTVFNVCVNVAPDDDTTPESNPPDKGAHLSDVTLLENCNKEF
jgi:hypothetical protein